MKNVSLSVCLIAVALILSSNVYAQNNQGYIQGSQPAATVAPNEQQTPAPVCNQNRGCSNNPLNKLGRGVSNILTFYLEIPASELRSGRQHGDSFGSFVTGTIEGIGTSLYRALTGICDTITFFAPPYDKPLMRPEYAEQSLSKEDRD